MTGGFVAPDGTLVQAECLGSVGKIKMARALETATSMVAPHMDWLPLFLFDLNNSKQLTMMISIISSHEIDISLSSSFERDIISMTGPPETRCATRIQRQADLIC